MSLVFSMGRAKGDLDNVVTKDEWRKRTVMVAVG